MGRGFEIKYHPFVLEKDIPKLDFNNKLKIKNAIKDKLLVVPEVFGKPLRQTLRGNRKLRVGDYRIIFKIENLTIKILIIGHRTEVYKKALKRLPR
ncbi:MAG: type II toxin-antitoxin system RelE/ParE family toxin [Patescibacteria group bacterium]